MPEPAAAVLLPRPQSGRVVETNRRVRLGDVAPSGRARLDAIARYLQDIARDDSSQTDLENAMGWVVRRTLIEVHRAPTLEEWLDLATWCSGHGGRWAERRTEIRGERGAEVDSVTLWVHVDPATGRPMRLGERFFAIWGEAAGGRRVSARTALDPVPAPGSSTRTWPLRVSDLDVLGHMNNAAHWAAVEDAIGAAGPPPMLRAELEHGVGVEAHNDLVLHVATTEGGLDSWLTADGVTASVARVRELTE